MKRKLFLTGPMGCGKSTAIARALGSGMARCGGFLTRRHREPHLRFLLESPDGRRAEAFLAFPGGKPEVKPEVFSSLGVELLRPRTGSGGIAPCVLDEIGGIELLCPEFVAALDAVLESDIPLIGVLKGEGPAGALIAALGLTAAYEAAADRLRERLRQDADTLLYECGQYDENALRLAEQWAEEYLHD